MSAPLKIVSVFPDVLGTYGDSGNVLVLHQRLAWRDIPVVTVRLTADQPLPGDGDLYVLGGSEDDAQAFAVGRLQDEALHRAVERGAHVFAVCAGLQMLGHRFTTGAGDEVPGLGLLDLVTTRLPERVVGEVTVNLGSWAEGRVTQRMSGFANHGGGSVLGSAATPLGITLSGGGNTGQDADPEGAVQGNVVATYLHGPVLARNPDLADWLLERATGAALSPLPRGPAEVLHEHLTLGSDAGRHLPG